MRRRFSKKLASSICIRAAGSSQARQQSTSRSNCLYSGPAAGVLAGRFLAATLDVPNVCTIDMGGTSLDVCLIRDGEPDTRDTIEVEWGIPARTQSIDIHSVGAGGGSIVWFDAGGALRIGPASAGSDPGPACYGRGGVKPTVTDANLLLGILNPEGLLGGRLRLDRKQAEAALRPIANKFGVSVGGGCHEVSIASSPRTLPKRYGR